MADATYSASYRALSRQHRNANRFVFGATSDSDASAIANDIAAALAANLNGLTRYVTFSHEGTTHPAGTRYSGLLYLVDGNGVVQKMTIRNLLATVDAAAMEGVFVGNASVVGGGPITRLTFTRRTLPGPPV